MKKFWIWLIPFIAVGIISAGIVIGVFVTKNVDNNSIVFATEIYWNHEQIVLAKGDECVISKNEITVEPKNCTQSIVYSTDSSDIINVDPSTGVVKALSVGECNLIATINTSESSKKTVRIKVIVNSSDTPSSDKEIKSESLTFSLSNGFEVIYYNTDCAFDERNFSVNIGAQNIEIAEASIDRINVLLKAVGEAEIVVETPNEILKFHITIV